jgi:phosphoenolpyruvate-protein kinase (PTS system EI component)
MSVGIHELSMSPNKVAEVKYAVRQMTMKRVEDISEALINMETAEEVRLYLMKNKMH